MNKPQLLNSMSCEFEELIPLNATNESISEIANSLREELKFVPTEADALDNLIKQLGGKIFNNIDFSDKSIGSMATIDKKFEIGIQVYEYKTRRRFTIAHELGHYVLHSLFQNNKPIKAYRNYCSEAAEYEANKFAANFLMPKDLFKQEFNKAKKVLSVLSTKFHVSEQAATIRAKELCLS